MAGALFPRLTTWNSSADLSTATFLTQLNAEFDNILNNLLPTGIDDYSINVTQMQIQTDPGEVGSESLATTLAGEFARLRFAIKEMKGTTYWYSTAASSIAELASALGGGLPANRVSSGRVRTTSGQPIFLVPHGTNATVTCAGAVTPFIYYVNSTQYTISTNVTATSLVTAPSSNNTAAVNDSFLSNQAFSKLNGEYGTEITIDGMGSNITTLIGSYAGFKIVHGGSTEYVVAKVESATKLTQIIRGSFFDSSDAPIPRIGIADNDVITLMKLTWVFAATDGTLAISYTNPRYAKTQPSSPSIGDYWFDLNNHTWKVFSSGSAWVSANATIIGYCMQDSSGTKAARSFDTFQNFGPLNTIKLEYVSATEVRGINLGAEISVYGSTFRFDEDVPRWSMTTDLDSGVSEAASTPYYFYVTDQGNCVISDKTPADRTFDRQGLYHPDQNWRCVGQAFNDPSQDLQAMIDYSNTDRLNIAVTATVAGSALTLTLHTNPLVKYPLKSATATSGVPEMAQVPFPMGIVVSSSATLDHVNATNGNIYLYLMKYSNNVDIAVSSIIFPNDTQFTSTAMSGSATDGDLYSNVVHTTKSILLMSHLISNQSTAGTWAAVPTQIACGFMFERANRKLSGSSGSFTTTSSTATDVTNVTVTINTTGTRPVRLRLVGSSSADSYLGTNRTGATPSATDFLFLRDGTEIMESTLAITTATTILYVPPSSMNFTDFPAVGKHVYKLQTRVDADLAGGGTASVSNVSLEVEET